VYSTALLATNEMAPTTWTMVTGALPVGLQLSKTGVIAGKPTATGTANFTIEATDQSGYSATATLSLTIDSGLIVATPRITPAGGTVADFVKVTLSCPTAKATIGYTTDGTEPTTNSSIYRTALTLTNSTTLKVKAFKDGSAASVTTSASYIITTPAITTAPALPDCVLKQAYRTILHATNGAAPYRWSVVSGSLPTGLKLTSAGVISGKATAAGSATVTVQVSDAKKGIAQQVCTVQVN